MKSCDTVRDDLGEFVLGVLDGDRRAALIDHLAECPACRDEVNRLAAVADAMLVLSPGVDPGLGFEDRVLARIPAGAAAGPAPAPAEPAAVVDEVAERRRSRRLLPAIPAALLIVVLGAALAVAVHRSSSADLSVRSATMRTTEGRAVGKVTLTAQPSAVLVAAPGWNDADRAYRLEVTMTDGRTVDDGSIVLDDGYGGYGLAGVRLADVRRVDMVDSSGHVACSATFG